MAEARHHGQAAGDAKMSSARSRMQQEASSFVREVKSGLLRFQGKLKSVTQQAIAKARGPLSSLAGRISQAQAKIEQKAQQEKRENEHKSLLDKAVDKVTGWIKSFVSWIEKNWKKILVFVAIVVALVIIGIVTDGLGDAILLKLGAEEGSAVAFFGSKVIAGRADAIVDAVRDGKGWKGALGALTDVKGYAQDVATAGLDRFVGGRFKNASSAWKRFAGRAGISVAKDVAKSAVGGKNPLAHPDKLFENVLTSELSHHAKERVDRIGVPKSGKTVTERVHDGGNPPPHAEERPERYYYDTKSSRYKRRPDDSGLASERARKYITKITTKSIAKTAKEIDKSEKKDEGQDEG